MNIYYTVYQTTNLINGKIYIGAHRTKNPYDDYLGTNISLHRAIKKYGRENFSKEILHIFDNEDDMWNKEKELVNEEFYSRTDTYNIGEGGRGWTGLGQYIVDNKVGILSEDYLKNKKSEVSKRVLREMCPIKAFEIRSKAGKAGVKMQKENKIGIFGRNEEERIAHAKHANNKQKELGVGFYSSDTQRELGKRGGKKIKELYEGFKWYTDGKNEYWYTPKEQEELPFDEFLKQNPQYKPGRNKVPYKPRNTKGRVLATNGVVNIQFKSPEERDKYIQENEGFRKGRTNLNKKNK